MRNKPLTCKEIKRALHSLGFTPRPKKGTSHEQWVGYRNGTFRKVTVDCPKSPFSQDLIAYMASQTGVSRKELYRLATQK